MADAFSSDIERGPNRFGSGVFAGMADQMQAAVTRVGEDIAKQFGWSAGFIAAEAKSDHSISAPLHRELRDREGGFRAKISNGVGNPERFDGGPLGFAPDGIVNGRKVLPLPQDHAG